MCSCGTIRAFFFKRRDGHLFLSTSKVEMCCLVVCIYTETMLLMTMCNCYSLLLLLNFTCSVICRSICRSIFKTSFFFFFFLHNPFFPLLTFCHCFYEAGTVWCHSQFLNSASGLVPFSRVMQAKRKTFWWASPIPFPVRQEAIPACHASLEAISTHCWCWAQHNKSNVDEKWIILKTFLWKRYFLGHFYYIEALDSRQEIRGERSFQCHTECRTRLRCSL